MSRNVGKELPICAALCTTEWQISAEITRRKGQIVFGPSYKLETFQIKARLLA
jgi:hypothetical protein